LKGGITSSKANAFPRLRRGCLVLGWTCGAGTERGQSRKSKRSAFNGRGGGGNPRKEEKRDIKGESVLRLTRTARVVQSAEMY